MPCFWLPASQIRPVRADTAMNWTLELPVFASVWCADAPRSQLMSPQQPPGNLQAELSWWWPSIVRVNADDFVRGRLVLPCVRLIKRRVAGAPSRHQPDARE